MEWGDPIQEVSFFENSLNFLFIINILSIYLRYDTIVIMETQTQMKPKTTAVDFLLNVGAIIVLYAIVSSLLALIFIVVEKAYPRITDGYDYYYSQSISWPVSILIVLFPVFIAIMRFLEKSYSQDPEKRNLSIHKWLTYITLFVGGAILIGDLIIVLYYFIDGQELTTSFLLKVFSVLAITLIVFLYYIADARNTLTSSKKKIWLGVSTIVIVLSITWGFSVLGSPRTQQLLKYDQQKVNDLQSINGQVINYYGGKGTLPKTIEEMSNGNYYIPQLDSQTRKPYEYQKIDDTTYNLCVEFNKASDDKNAINLRHYYDNYGGANTWTHPAGRYCFKETINTEMNNKYPKPAPLKY